MEVFRFSKDQDWFCCLSQLLDRLEVTVAPGQAAMHH
jgi:hypothetical protein